jgi:antirestriction protein ArdC
MEYYSSIAHEMAHSTGVEKRLGRDMEGHFGDPKYAKEELVAELTAAMVGNTMGFDKRILDNNAKYVDGWMDTLKKGTTIHPQCDGRCQQGIQDDS